MSIHLEADTEIWIVAGSPTCHAQPCSRPAAIITITDGYPRFCQSHTEQAAAVALQHNGFSGWWPITSHHRHDPQLLMTVHPL